MPTYDGYDLCLDIIYMLSVLICFVCTISYQIRLLYQIIFANTSNSDIILHIVKHIPLSLSLSLLQSDNLTYTLDSFHYSYGKSCISSYTRIVRTP